MCPVLPADPEEQGKEVRMEEANKGVQGALEPWPAGTLRSWPRWRCPAKRPGKSMGVTRSWNVSALEKWEFGAWGRCLLWVFAFFMNSLHSAVPSFLLISGTCVAYFTVLLVVEKEKNLERKWFNLLLLGCLLFSQGSSLLVDCKILPSKNFLIVN